MPCYSDSLCFSRHKIVSILCNLFRSVIALSPDELLPCVYLCLNQVCAIAIHTCSPTPYHYVVILLVAGSSLWGTRAWYRWDGSDESNSWDYWSKSCINKGRSCREGWLGNSGWGRHSALRDFISSSDSKHSFMAFSLFVGKAQFSDVMVSDAN